MRRKIKTLSSRVIARKSVTSGTAASRRPFPAWIDADERGVAFSAVTPRVRDGLVLRTVAKKKSANPKASSDGPGTR
jgi:hypothetical protein